MGSILKRFREPIFVAALLGFHWVFSGAVLRGLLLLATAGPAAWLVAQAAVKLSGET